MRGKGDIVGMWPTGRRHGFDRIRHASMSTACGLMTGGSPRKRWPSSEPWKSRPVTDVRPDCESPLLEAIARAHACALHRGVRRDEGGIGVGPSCDEAERTTVELRVGRFLAGCEKAVGVEIKPRRRSAHAESRGDGGTSCCMGSGETDSGTAARTDCAAPTRHRIPEIHRNRRTTQRSDFPCSPRAPGLSALPRVGQHGMPTEGRASSLPRVSRCRALSGSADTPPHPP